MFRYSREAKTEVVETYHLVDVICNSCGQSVRLAPANHSVGTNKLHISCLEWLDITKVWGFNSHKDMLKQSAHLCEPCWDNISSAFAISPDVLEEEDPQLDLFAWEDLYD